MAKKPHIKVRLVPEAKPDSTFFYKTLSENSYLMNEIKKQFELVVPEMYKKQKRLIDGEEFDLDSVLEAIVDIKA